MTDATLNLLHEVYQDVVSRSDNILEIVENLYKDLSEREVDPADSKQFDSFVDGLRACIRVRQKTFYITSQTTYINTTLMYIICWMNDTQGSSIDINLLARRKSLESDLTKILSKSCDNRYGSANIRDRFGLRAILLNDFPTREEANKYIYDIFDAICGIFGGQNRQMKKAFTEWCAQKFQLPIDFWNSSFSKDMLEKLPLIPPDALVIWSTLNIPFSIEYVKDFIKEPKENGYQSLQFTMIIQMYSNVLPGCQLEVQLRTKEMHSIAVSGTACHDDYKEGFGNENVQKLNKVFTVDDFSKLNIIGFKGYNSPDDDHDGIHFSKVFCNRRISTSLVNS